MREAGRDAEVRGLLGPSPPLVFLSGQLGTNKEGGTTEGRGLEGRGLWDYKFCKGCSTLRTGSPRIH
ncbi:hypothetical protein LEMLEM_LOCUS14080 [Lemmus lemmus]